MKFERSLARLCLVTDRRFLAGRRLIDVVDAAARGGATMVQLREKHAPTREFLEDARALKALLAGRGVALIVNDRIDVALAVDADGVHVGQTDMPLAIARRLLGPYKWIGLSITNEEQIRQPDAQEADYLGVGPLYAQDTKGDASTPLGVDGFLRLRAMTDLPVIAIGGLKPDNSAAVAEAGADGLAVVSAIMGAEDPEAAARGFRGLFP
jgi:thiamine-phosphate pyrophosphorylase